MNARTSTRSVVVGVLAAVAIVTPIVVIALDAAHGWISGGVYLVFAPVIVVFAAVAWLLQNRRPENVIGVLCLVFALIFAAYFPIDLLVRLVSTSPAVALVATLSSSSDATAFILVALILLLFPDGAVPGPRWRWVIPTAIVGSALSMVGFTLQDGPLPAFPTVENPIGIPGFPGAVMGEIGYIILLVLLVAAIPALIVRWRRGTGLERTQVKWVAAASVVLFVGESANLATFDATDPLGNPIAILAGTFATAAVPIAIGTAILRYRLYEIDRIISRTISYGVVLGILAVVFVGVILLLQAVLARFTQGETIAVAASTLAVFALFQPVLRRVRHAVDRRFDRAAYDAERTVASFAERLRSETDMETVSAELLTTVRDAIAPTAVGMWLRAERGER